MFETVPEGTGLAVHNPATGGLIATVREYAPAEISAIIDAADAARPAWAAETAKARAAVLRRWYTLIMERQEELAAIITAECGKPLTEARGEVAYGASFIEWFAEEAKRAYGETVPTFAAGKRVLTIKQPVGTCAAITPWNFPIAMITRKVGPALAAGCSIVVKPAEATPLSALALETLAREAGVPADLFRVTPSNDPAAVGTLFCHHPKVRKLSFTGSTRVGKILMAQAAENVTRLSLELGGNAPFIVFDDADLDAAADGLMASKFRNAGQTCVCANRVLVQDGVYDAFVERVRAKVAALVVGDGAKPGTTIGPLINAAAVEKVDSLVRDALAGGASALLGGNRSNAGAGFFEPTVLTGVRGDMTIATSEIFGPVVPLIRFTDEAEAVRLANDTPYGLAAYFYARDLGRVWRVMEALEYGMVGVNDGILSTEVAPFGGIKQSGLGREGSRHGLDEYLELKYCLMGGIGA
ncbi:NAD-dependent succinate-semialdehyde dehydrogenase [Novosphingobium sediminis]|uniref:NAD-dependent succinate-semialdehyde dehydrogenase n=1 Tax=Novosphingobium sediminis TaxID=707214 RepID=A0A512AFZ3_9SPHN|nr:NAD-dependent succinate-semialdehyde dehydrogenase [Novosphingobium sediminis]GEN98627.1 NAD-dependent succinate-semialdehyde dehydrogenase [Novosphingobium sediminis]